MSEKVQLTAAITTDCQQGNVGVLAPGQGGPRLRAGWVNGKDFGLRPGVVCRGRW
jgi:hypothetical protein